MKTYILNIIPKIRKYSENLDNLSLLTNQHWVVFDEIYKTKIVYIFRDNKELLIAMDGKVEKMKWEYLGQNTILIDLKDQSYLFKHGFFDENILALRIDSKDEYFLLINESKYQGELNSMSAITNFLNQKYLVNPPYLKQNILKSTNEIEEINFVRNGFSFKMGKYKEYSVLMKNGQLYNVYQRSDASYFIYKEGNYISFESKAMCINYLKNYNKY